MLIIFVLASSLPEKDAAQFEDARTPWIWRDRHFQCSSLSPARSNFQCPEPSIEDAQRAKARESRPDIAESIITVRNTARSLVESKMKKTVGCNVWTVAINGRRGPENHNAANLCYDPKLTFPLKSGDWTGHHGPIGGTATCTVSTCHRSKPSETLRSLKLVGYIEPPIWQGKKLVGAH